MVICWMLIRHETCTMYIAIPFVHLSTHHPFVIRPSICLPTRQSQNSHTYPRCHKSVCWLISSSADCRFVLNPHLIYLFHLFCHFLFHRHFIHQSVHPLTDPSSSWSIYLSQYVPFSLLTYL